MDNQTDGPPVMKRSATWQTKEDDKWVYTYEGGAAKFSTQQEALQMEDQQQYIEQVRTANRQIWDGINKLVELQKQWTALDYDNALTDSVTGLTAGELRAVVFDTADTLVKAQATVILKKMARLL